MYIFACLKYFSKIDKHLILSAIVERVKQVANVDYDPDNDKKIRNIIKWKGLLDKGIITKDEFAAKRAAILAISEEEDYE